MAASAFRVLLVSFLCNIGFCVSAVMAEAQGVIVQYHPWISVPQARNTAVVTPNRHVEHVDRFFDNSVGSRVQMNALLERYRADTRVAFVEPNHLGRFTDVPASLSTPTDPSYTNQWWAEAVFARAGWAISTGAQITVAVIDTGVDLAHPDLVQNLRTDGFNFGGGFSDVTDLNGHGTAVAGLIAASCYNGVGGCGLAYGAKILPIKVNGGNSSTFDSATLAQSIRYAVQKGAKVINLSLTVDEQTQTVAGAIDEAVAAGVVVVAAAGNSTGAVQFPGNHPGVIGVAAIDANRSLFANSSRGPEVAIAAPGVNIVTTLLGGTIGSTGSGTSFAAPIVSAAAAQMLSLAPGLSPSRVKSLLERASQPLNGLPFGVLDSGAVLYGLLPDLIFALHSATQGSSGYSNVAFQVPATGGGVDLYFAIHTPWGEYSLGADGNWQPTGFMSGLATIANYDAEHPLGGLLYGPGGVFQALSIAALPVGEYRFSAAAVNRSTSQRVGPVLTSQLTILSPQ